MKYSFWKRLKIGAFVIFYTLVWMLTNKHRYFVALMIETQH